MISTLHELSLWLPEMSLTAKFIISAIVVLIAIFVLMLIWAPHPTVSDQKISPRGSPQIIEQRTEGNNSPTVGGVEGNVTITIEEKRNRK